MASPVEELRERNECVRAAIGVHRAMVLGAWLEALEPELIRIDGLWRDLDSLPAEEEHVERLTAIRAATEALEAEALRMDAAVPMSDFRHAFDPRKTTFEAALSYARMLARRIDETVERRGRVDFLATHLVSQIGPDGQFPVPWESAEPVLSCLTVHRASEEARAAAEAFFREAEERLARCVSVEEIFEGGLLLDLEGYKRTLGPDHLDSRVLYASARLNLAIGRRLQALVHEQGLPPGELNVRYAKLGTKVRSIFRETRIFESPSNPRFAVRPIKGAPRTAVPRRLSRSPRQRVLLRAIGAVVALSGGAAFARDAYLRRDPLLTLRGEDLRTLGNGALEEGAVANGVFIGNVGSGWDGLDDASRQQIADSLAKSLRGRQVTAAVVFDRSGRNLVLQIDKGRVVAFR